ncbi:MAG: antibiotic biosynthesis monooxygenase [Alphaproteobacteria bacterium]|nr:antibiotic biosynthesis monooxygenase [Alphaproteobacteria bacterium]MDE1940353.1 antibiotic biosynthesis monooxygenase [Alphaproteobacteria bacterium]MDE2013777.1 antibiotic biosynthesis monooxygenase [Alphaproteobacteria bacterium]MDE2075239.1 antibiotic biosynthesis monooxygenase [Alphaproteobacteria bacterium]MDE2351441.1 antibiotic biosynthesis monooxygenase [Alphaproteobacteria bacterium]
MAIGAIATLKVREGKEAEFEAAFGELMAAVRAGEPGNRLYQLCRSRSEAGTYVVMEIYESDEAAKVHVASAHFKAFGPKLGPFVAGPPDVKFFDLV